MNILAFTSHFPEKKFPTRATYNLNTFNALSKYVNIEVICPKPWWEYVIQKQTIQLSYHENYFGIHTLYPTFLSIPKFSFFHGIAMFFSLYPTMYSIFKRKKFDIILSAWVYPDCMASVLFSKLFKCPNVSIALGSDINELTKRFLLRPQVKFTLNESTKIIAVSNALAKKIESLGINPNKIIVQHNGVDGKIFSIKNKKNARNKLGISVNENLIVFIGNFSPEKGVDILIYAIHKLIQSKKLSDIRCVLIGDGIMKSKLHTISHELKIENNINFVGRKLPFEVAQYLNAADVLCVPSFREGCPNVILESLASGCPVVASDVGGIPELINHNNGILVECGDSGKLSDALYLSLQKQWESKLLRKSVEFLSWSSVGQMYKKLFENLLCSVVSQK